VALANCAPKQSITAAGVCTPANVRKRLPRSCRRRVADNSRHPREEVAAVGSLEGPRFCGQCAATLAAGPAIPEERKTVTTLFCDLVSFTARTWTHSALSEMVKGLPRGSFSPALRSSAFEACR